MRLEFGGLEQQSPSIVLMTDLLQGGPALMMRGNGRDQVITLGFVNDDSAAPRQRSKLWGLFFPGHEPFKNLAGIGMAENLNSDERRGLVFPLK